MIKSEKERNRAQDELDKTRQLLQQNMQLLKSVGLKKREMSPHVLPTTARIEALEAELKQYDLIMQGKIDQAELASLGQLLIAVRLFRRMTQKALSERLDIDETQVSRDEKNEYRGVGFDRLARVCEALGIILDIKPHTAQPAERHRPSIKLDASELVMA